MKTSRRLFIKKSAMSIGALGLASSMPILATAARRSIPASDKILVGLIGCNGMGFADLKSFLVQPGVECAAICDVDANVLGRRVAEVETLTGKKPRMLEDFRELIGIKDINVIIIGTPDHWHCMPMVYACEEGKDVYVEKPLANTIQECNIMLKAARKYNRVVQVGQWQRSDPHWKEVVDFVQSGKLGRIRTVKVWAYIGWKGEVPVLADEPVPQGVNYDMWLGPAAARPFNRNRFHFTFRWFWDYAGGLMTDWGVHLLDYGLYGMNVYVPKSVISSGGKYAFPNDAMETPDTQQAIYEFQDFGLIWDHTIGIYGGPYGREHGVAYIGEYGTLVVDRAGWEVIPELDMNKKEKMEKQPLKVRSGEASGLDLHVMNFLECIRTREKPNADIEIGAHIARIAHLGNIAYRTGRKVFWDAANNNIINDPEASKLVNASYRTPWKIPAV